MEISSDSYSDRDTFFAPAEKASDEEFRHEIEVISKNPIIDSIIDNVSGLLAVLNKHRQVISVNSSLLRMLGIKNAEETLGLRHGQVFKCIHGEEAPNGCGTTKYCSTCGAAIAIVTCLESKKTDKRVCVMTTEKDGKSTDLYLQVQACPIVIDSERYILLFIQDVTDGQQRAALERSFFHDISNIIQALVNSSYQMNLRADANTKELTSRMKKITTKLAKEVEIQRTLSRIEHGDYNLLVQPVALNSIIQEVQDVVTNHPAATGKYLHISDIPDIELNTDSSLLVRILTNMTVNAFEATSDGNEVKIYLKQSGDNITFSVWNKEAIPEDIALRIFQRNYTTKNESGRGLGTYVMKHFGENYLGGKVEFSTSVTNGTVFSFTQPISTNQ
jgi:K+-sensing histidine kinase KdpD